ncbi:hypothetical protein GQ457_17G000650 [Hibiscus cannabinus]
MLTLCIPFDIFVSENQQIQLRIKESNCLFCILSPIPLLLRALRKRSDHIDIPSTQHRSSKRSRRLTKARKPGFFRKWIPIRRVHNRMDKLTLTCQFGIQFEIFLWGYPGKGSLLIQMLYLWDRDRERGKNRRFHIVLLIEKSI